MQYLVLFFSTLLICLTLDALWIGVIAKSFYDNAIGHLLRKTNGTFDPNWPAVILVYFFIVLGILCFALPKANHNVITGFFWGAILGFVIYGVYDATNFSTLATWPLKMSIIDCVWGMILCGLATSFAVFIQNRMSS